MYKEYIKPLLDSGMSYSDTVAYIKTHTKRPIPRLEALAYMQSNRIVWQNAEGKFTGPLATVLASTNDETLDRFLGYVRRSDYQFIHTHGEEGPDAILLISTLVTLGVINQQQADEFLGLGGGIIWLEATVDGVLALETAYDAEASAQEMLQTVLEKNAQSVQAALVAASQVDATPQSILDAALEPWQ